MNKQLLIEEKLMQPFKVGDDIVVTLTYTTTKDTYIKKKKVTTSQEETRIINGRIIAIGFTHALGELFEIDTYSSGIPYEAQLSSEDVAGTNLNSYRTVRRIHAKHSIDECGANPFRPKKDIRFTNSNIESILFKAGYGYNSDDFNTKHIRTVNDHKDNLHITGKTYGGINFNPYVIDVNGNRVYFQRDLVWTLDQKQELISSIYNGIEIGKFIFRYKSWEDITKQILETGHGYNFDCVDGKQRFNAILEFVQNKYPDEYGNYWNDLSPKAQRIFLSYGNLATGELGEGSTDEDVIATFLTINFTGTPMSREHIEFVQSIKIKC